MFSGSPDIGAKETKTKALPLSTTQIKREKTKTRNLVVVIVFLDLVFLQSSWGGKRSPHLVAHL